MVQRLEDFDFIEGRCGRIGGGIRVLGDTFKCKQLMGFNFKGILQIIKHLLVGFALD